MATGGYANNPDMYMALQAENAKGLCGVVPFGNFNAQGQGIKACLWAGAVKDENPTSMVFDRGIMRPDQLPGAPFDRDCGYFHMATQPFLKVDIEGERITNESSPYDFLIHALARKSSQRAWFDIWDSNWPTDIERFHTIGCSGLIKGEGTNPVSYTHLATVCWASTSSALRTSRVLSMAPASMPSAMTAASMTSTRVRGKMMPWERPPTWWLSLIHI